MPSKARRDRAEQQKKLDAMLKNAPIHIKRRDANITKVALSLAGELKPYSFRGVNFTDRGEPTYLPHGCSASNDARREEADATCRKLKRKYGKKWGLRRFISEIAKVEGVSSRTVERYFKRCP